MPSFNGTGPMGEGPLSGRGMGYCAGEEPQDFYGRGRGFRGPGRAGMGMQRGRGFGRGFAGGMGRGIYSLGPMNQQYRPTLEELEQQKSALESMITRMKQDQQKENDQ